MTYVKEGAAYKRLEEKKGRGWKGGIGRREKSGGMAEKGATEHKDKESLTISLPTLLKGEESARSKRRRESENQRQNERVTRRQRHRES